MTIGLSIFLLAIGAILAFAVDADLAGVDLVVVGWILMLAGLVGMIAALAFGLPRRQRSVSKVRHDVNGQPAAETTRVVETDPRERDVM